MSSNKSIGVPPPSDVDASQVWVVIPAYNEARAIRPVVEAVCELGFSVVVVDDCSKDGTYEVLEGSRAYRLRHSINLGQGASLQTGVTFALTRQAQYIATFDADGQHDANEILPMVQVLRRDNLDIVLGSRFLELGHAKGISKSRRLLLKAATLFTRMSTGLVLTDTHNGLRVMTREAALKVKITQNRMSHASQILSQIAALKLKYCEYPVTITYSQYSMAKGQHAGNAFNILWESFKGSLFQ